MEYCSDHPKLMSTLSRIDERTLNLDKRINGSIDDIHNHIKSGHNWRTSIIAIAVTLIINLLVFAYYYGQLNQKVIHIESRVWAVEK